jgi:hypothetical protein
MIIRYLENPHTGLLTLVRHNDLDLKWARRLTTLIIHEFEQNSPEHTMFLLRNFNRLHNNDIEDWT